MKRTVIVKDASDLTGPERKSCFAMSYGNGGSLSEWLHLTKSGIYTGDVVLVKEGETIVGWCMRLQNGDVGFWTRTTHRKRGIGTLMVQEVSKLGRIHTDPHDYKSAKLFIKTNSLPRGQVRDWKARVKLIEQGSLGYLK